MNWRGVAWAAIWLPVVVIALAPLIALLLPRICCERLRAVRYLFLMGTCYYGVLLIVAAFVCSVPWWAVMLLAAVAVFGGGWLLPDPVSFLLKPGNRRASVRAVEWIESQGDSRAIYNVSVIGVELSRRIVSVDIDTDTIPVGQRFLAVGDDGSIEELDFDHVSKSFGVTARL